MPKIYGVENGDDAPNEPDGKAEAIAAPMQASERLSENANAAKHASMHARFPPRKAASMLPSLNHTAAARVTSPTVSPYAPY